MSIDHVAEFVRRSEVKKKNGLIGMHVTFKRPCSNAQELCKELNAIDDAIARGDVEDYDFGDSTHKVVKHQLDGATH